MLYYSPEGLWVKFAGRFCTDAELQYVAIEGEAAVITWA